MTTKQYLKWGTNSKVYKKKLKRFREDNGIIKCSICPYHDNENHGRRDEKSWKTNRKTQYRAIDYAA